MKPRSNPGLSCMRCTSSRSMSPHRTRNEPRCRHRTYHLPIEEVQLGVQRPISPIICAARHCPAPVMIKSGIAAIAAARMITR